MAILDVALRLLLASCLAQASFYPESSPVLELTAVSYQKIIAESNHTSMVEFFAPWCGHCKNLKPAYEKAANSLKGLANVAAVDCDDSMNKPLCGQLGIKGFPTLKIVKPGSKPGKPRVKDYNGERTAKAIVDAIVEEIPDHVTRLFGHKIEQWVGTTAGARVVLFTDKQAKSPLYRSLAVDFLGRIAFAQIRETEKEAVSKYGVVKYPTLLFFGEGDGTEPIRYSGKMRKPEIAQFLSSTLMHTPSQAAPAPEAVPEQEPMESVVQDSPISSPDPMVTPAPAKKASDLPLPIPIDSSEQELRALCLTPSSPTCVFILLAPSEEQAYNQGADASESSEPKANPPKDVQEVLKSLADLKQQYLKNSKSFFPVFAIDVNQRLNHELRTSFGMRDTMQIVAVNGKRGWWNQYGGTSADRQEDNTPLSWSLENLGGWIDDIKLGNAKKEKIIADLIKEREVVADGKPAEEVKEAQVEDEANERHDEL